ncbi:hypothetical protein K470DRAFT_255583 [Piedraia hortae CBS 480.64]|uniref:Uncharacterized protein n=1 Tax=Piedraia hortae CBS 480.64 TaxID=1314780 RepID=A0A6A7C4Z2_9PEZI|nr:hypothetical protein K470DRAFT_255583 [Piedraia hortae CBS 480.64]
MRPRTTWLRLTPCFRRDASVLHSPNTHRSPLARKTQLHRQYQSLLRSTPLMLFFQHNSLTAREWESVRRELRRAVGDDGAGAAVRLQVVGTGIFDSALRVVEFWDRDTGGLSEEAWRATSKGNQPDLHHPFEDITCGPLAVLTFPSIDPTLVKAALQILAPQASAFPAPKKRLTPSYYERPVQDGVAKLMLLGARVGRNAQDIDGVRWLGSLPNLDGLRAQLVAILSSAGRSVTDTLSSPGQGLYITVDGRRRMLE